MIDLKNIRSLSDFQRHAREHIAKLKRTGKPAILTINGQAEVVVQDVSSYQRLLDELEQAQGLAGLRRGLTQANSNEGRPMRDVVEELEGRAAIRSRRGK